MARRIRAARHYQSANDPARRTADKFKPQLARQFSEAFRHLGSMVDVDLLTREMRHARNPADLINWHHYREILKKPLNLLAVAYRAGAQVGENKINAKFSATGRKVRYRKRFETFATHGSSTEWFERFSKKPDVRELQIARHGATKLNSPDIETDRIRGWLDVPLSPEGHKEAKRLAQEIKKDKANWPQVIYASDLQRAAQTAQYIADALGMKCKKSRSLRPWDVGDLAGKKTKTSIPILMEHIEHPDKPLPGGETFNEFHCRAFDCILWILEHHRNERVLIVTHHRIERLMFGWRDADFPRSGQVKPGTFSSKGETTASRRFINIPMDKLAAAVGRMNNYVTKHVCKSTKEEANYRVKGKKGARCGDCWMFEPPASCCAVEGSISDLATCDYFEPLLSKALGDRFNFDMLDAGTQQALRDAQDEFIQQLESDSRDAIAQIVLDGERTGASISDIASDIRDYIGLTDTQAQAVMNYERMLSELDPGALTRQLRNTEYDAVLQDAIDSGVDLNDLAIQNMVDDYVENYLDYRAATIARTEATRATNLGLHDAYSQAVDRGAIPEEAITRQWQLGDSPCAICESIPDNNPDGVGVNDDFDSDDGTVSDPPVHPNCQCSVDYVTDLTQLPDDSDESEYEFQTQI